MTTDREARLESALRRLLKEARAIDRNCGGRCPRCFEPFGSHTMECWFRLALAEATAALGDGEEETKDG